MLVNQGRMRGRRGQSNSIEGPQQGENYLSTKCCVDGSWMEGGNAGIGMVLSQDGRLLKWESKYIQAISPTKAEAVAVLEGLKLIRSYGDGEGVVLSDSLETVQALSSDKPEITDWRSYEQIWEAWFLLAEAKGKMKVEYCNRGEHEMTLPHLLANQGRLQMWEKKRQQ